jgi:hypothetical protein
MAATESLRREGVDRHLEQVDVALRSCVNSRNAVQEICGELQAIRCPRERGELPKSGRDLICTAAAGDVVGEALADLNRDVALAIARLDAWRSRDVEARALPGVSYYADSLGKLHAELATLHLVCMDRSGSSGAEPGAR